MSYLSCVEQKLNFALHYAKRWSVFPVPPNTRKSYKCAEYSGGARWGATRDAEQIIQDFTRWADAGIGIPTGADNSFWVLDIDAKHGVDGCASLRSLEEQHGAPLPDTLQSRTPHGGFHHFFKYPTDCEIRNSTSALGAGIDVRGEGGMILAPPSAGYCWRHIVPIAPAPAWLLELVVEKKPHTPTSSTLSFPPTINAERLAAALYRIPPDASRQIWFQVLAALHRIGGDALFWLAEDWSRGGAKFDKAELVRQWRSIQVGHYNFNAGTIFHYSEIYKNV